MLSNLKERLLNVKNTVPIFKTSAEDKQPTNKTSDLNYYAGAEVLSKYQEQWAAIHSQNEENAANAEKAAQKIDTICRRVKNDKQNIMMISSILQQGNLTSSITNCLRQIKELYDTCEQVEKDLIVFEDIVESKEIEKMMRQHAQLLDNYEQRKLDEMEVYKKGLEEEHLRKVQDFELSKQKTLEERQKVFQEAFRADMEVYRSSGAIPKVELNRQQSALLEEIQIDFDQNELEQFFKT